MIKALANMSVSDLLCGQTAVYRDKPFLVFERQPHKSKQYSDAQDESQIKEPLCFTRQWSYAEFNTAVNRACRLLESKGLDKGDVFNLHLPNCPAFMILWFASTRLGTVMMPTNILASVDELTYLLDHSQSKLSITTCEYLHTVTQCQSALPHLRQVICCDPFSHYPDTNSFESELNDFSGEEYQCAAQPQDMAAIMYTSGTTSRPKGVMVTHQNYIKAGATVADAIDMNHQDRNYTVLPLFHGNAQYYSTMSALITGATVVLMDRFSASQYFEKCIEHRCTMASLFAAPIRMILAQQERTELRENSLRVVLYAQNITEQQESEWHRRFNAPLSQLWGMTETMGPPLMNPYNGKRRNQTIGKPIGGYEIRLVTPDGQIADVGTEGEIIVKGIPGDTIMKGYYHNKQATREVIRDGWLYTGDNAIEDEQGYFRFVDRLKDMIKRSGENISAGEVESILLKHPDVFECAVIGLTDEMRDEKIVGVVVLKARAQISEQQLIEHCAKHLAKFRVPDQIHFFQSLPKTSVGKIQKHLIKDALTNGTVN